MNKFFVVVVVTGIGLWGIHGQQLYAQDFSGGLGEGTHGANISAGAPTAGATPVANEPAGSEAATKVQTPSKSEEPSKVDDVLNAMTAPKVQDLSKVPGPPQATEKSIHPNEDASLQRTIKEGAKVPPLDYVKIPIKKHGVIRRQQWHYIGPIEHINGQFVVELTSRGDVSLAVGTNALVEPFVEIRDPICVDGNLETQARRCVINQPGVYYIGLLGISSQNEYTVAVSGNNSP